MSDELLRVALQVKQSIDNVIINLEEDSAWVDLDDSYVEMEAEYQTNNYGGDDA